MNRLVAACAMSVFLNAAHAQSTTAPERAPSTAAPVTTSMAPIAPIDAGPAAPAGTRLDAGAATRAFMNRLQGEARAKSDAYAEGGYWLLLWNLLYELLVAWLLLSRRISLRMREFAERRTPRKNLQTLIYVLMYVPLVALLVLPITLYQGFYREHQYGLSNLSLLSWFGEAGIGVGVDMIITGIAVTGLYAILRRLPQSWWAWGSVAGAGFIMLLIMIGPVFIAPLFNTYKPLPAGPIRDDILSMARANGIPADNVYYFDASKQTKRVSANVSGLFGTTRISLNDNLLNRTTPAEIRAVMAHEMGHYVLNHGLKHTVSFTLVLLGGLLFIKYSWGWAA
ncbi:MAG: M48 family metalloprotease, partial [Betaproteobacteria bacterium]